MDQLSNAFSVLDLDVPDDQLSANEIPIKSDKGKQKGNISEDTMLATNNQHNQHNLSITSEEYKDKGKQKDNVSEDTTLATNNQHSQQNLSITSEEYKDKGKQKGNISEDTTLATNNQHNQQNLSITSEEYKDKGKQKGNISEDTTLATDNQHNQHNLSIASEEYKLPLVWIDLEMTGLNIEVDRILEIACIITDGNLIKSVEGPDLVIHQSKECLDNMGEWCQEHHAASGLTKKVLQSTITESEAEKQVTEFVKKHVGTYTPMLAGNSVYVDLLFLKKYMPDLASLFTHVLVDVSSIKALCIRWYPRDNKKAPSKENKHRAMDDIRESIAELKYYKEKIFKLKTKK